VRNPSRNSPLFRHKVAGLAALKVPQLQQGFPSGFWTHGAHRADVVV